MRGSDDLLPRIGGQLALGQHPPDVVVQDLGRGPGDRPQTVVTALLQELAERDPELRGAVQHLHRAERVDVDIRCRGLHRVEQVEVERPRQVGVDPALHAHLGAPPGRRLAGSVGDLGERERVGLRVDLALRERAEAAPDVADVGEVDVAVHDVGDVVADGVAPEPVGDGAQRLEVVALGPEQREGLLVGEGPARLGVGEPGPDLGDPSRRGGTRSACHARVRSGTSVSPYTISASARRPAPSTFANVSSMDRGFQATSGSCHAIGAAHRPSRPGRRGHQRPSTGARILPARNGSGRSANSG